MTKSILSFAMVATMAATAIAQTADRPVIRHVEQQSGGGHIMGVSDNGLWGVGYQFGDNGTYYCPVLLDVEKGTLINLFETGQEQFFGIANDVTDDGRFVAGGWETGPAVYYTDFKRWRVLPMPAAHSYENASAVGITPDGKYAIGHGYVTIFTADGAYFTEDPFFWDLTGNMPEMVALEGLPTIDLDGNRTSAVRFTKISPDGKYIVGVVDAMYPQTSYTFIYDVEKKSWQPLGMEYKDGKFTPTVDGVHGGGDACFSPNSRYLAMELNTDEGGKVGIMDLTTGEMKYIPTVGNMLMGGVDNYGTVYASPDPGTPLRNWSFYAGGYWYDWKQAAKQLFGIDWQKDITKDDFGMSGTFVGTSGDGLRLMSADYSGTPGGTYLVTMPKPISDYADVLDPLSNYSFYPSALSTFSTLRTINVYFDRDIEVVGDTRSVQLLNSKGEEEKTSMSAALAAGETRTLVVTFRNAALEAGETYTVLIPAGLVQAKGDPEHKNKEMKVQYIGRANEPVKPVKIAPEDGTAMPRLNMSTNPVTVEFDAVIMGLEGGKIGLYRVSEDGDEYLYALSANVENRTMTIFPAIEQELAKGITYKVVVEAGTVGDISGSNGNEKFEVTYLGTYEPQVTGDKVYEQNFDLGLAGMLLYDGDHNNPTQDMADWGFTYEYPWWYVRDNTETMDQAAASHSSYNPAGTSDDWMVTPRLWIPDATCQLAFDSQSYKKNKEDILKVYILATSDVYTAPINKSFIDRIKAEGELVLDEKQEPGDSEEKLAGEWRHNVISLEKYAGKHIYIAFANQNESQSAIFIDNLIVDRDLLFSVANMTPAYIEDAESAPVSVAVKAAEGQNFTSATFRLLDGDGSLVVEEKPENVDINAESNYNFTFSKELKLVKGTDNTYTIEAEIGDKTVVLPGTIKNLRFKPTRTIVLEEGTGTNCGYCPLGHRALEYMEEVFGEQIIPVAVHGYPQGSTFGSQWAIDYCQNLGDVAGFPFGSLNREVLTSPMYNDGVNYYFTSPEGNSTWCDFAGKMLAEMTDAEISISHATIDPETKKIEVGIKMRYAYDSDNTNLNLHTVVLENGLVSRQSNNLFSYGGPNLGEWGAGGKNGTDNPFTVFNHVARGMNGTSYSGVAGMFPRVIDSSKEYDRVYSFDTPAEVTKPENTDVVVMLVDANTNRIINAAKAQCLVGTVGLEGITTDGAVSGRGAVYSITGVKVLDNATLEDINRLDKGIYIFNGQKVMVR